MASAKGGQHSIKEPRHLGSDLGMRGDVGVLKTPIVILERLPVKLQQVGVLDAGRL